VVAKNFRSILNATGRGFPIRKIEVNMTTTLVHQLADLQLDEMSPKAITDLLKQCKQDIGVFNRTRESVNTWLLERVGTMSTEL
jgi:hypothetical protein